MIISHTGLTSWTFYAKPQYTPTTGTNALEELRINKEMERQVE